MRTTILSPAVAPVPICRQRRRSPPPLPSTRMCTAALRTRPSRHWSLVIWICRCRAPVTRICAPPPSRCLDLLAAGPLPPKQKKRCPAKDSVGLYAVQCCECYKLRTVPTKEEFEEIREELTDEPWFCSRTGCSCEEPADIEYGKSCVWVIDKPNIPKPPPETEGLLIVRGDYTKMDTYYVMPKGKRARCTGDVDKFLEAHPEYKGCGFYTPVRGSIHGSTIGSIEAASEYKGRISTSSFNFTPPKIVEDTVSDEPAWRAAKAKKQDKADSSSGQKLLKL